MKISYSKFPNEPVTQRVLKRESIGAVVACWSGRIYGKDPDKLIEDFSYTDGLITQAQNLGLDIHLHPVLTRYDRNELKPYDLFHAHYEQAKTIINRYAKVTDRITLTTELTVAPAEVWADVIRLYAWAARHHPDLKLWIGDYGISHCNRRSSLIQRLTELKTIVPNLAGFVGQDYVDLDDQGDKIARFFKPLALGTMPLMKFAYLGDFIKRVQNLGLDFALEHSTFSSYDSPQRRKAQHSIYGCLSKICNRTGAEFWLWDCCNASSKYFHNEKRKVYTGVWDVDGGARLTKNK